jgi:hypothetical protein
METIEMTEQERRNEITPNKTWLDVVQRWHSNQMTDTFYNYRDILDHEKSLDYMHPLERNIIGNIMAIMGFVYDQAYSFDHLESCFYKHAGRRLWSGIDYEKLDFPKGSKEYELNMQIPFEEIRSTKPIVGYPFIRVSKPTALKMMDYFETPEFAILLVTLRRLSGALP